MPALAILADRTVVGPVRRADPGTMRDTHPLGCHRPRIADRIVLDKLLQVLVLGAGYARFGLDLLGDNDPHPT